MKIAFFPPLPMGAVNLCWEDLGFPGGLVVKSLPANAGDMGATPVQEDSTRHGATRLLSHNCWARTLEPATAVRSLRVRTATRETPAQQRRPSTAKKKAS